MAALNQSGFKNLPGETLGALVNDYLEDVADWERGIAENYKFCYSAARSFVLPMNPPRFELGYAVRRFFSAHGVTVKKSHVVDLANRKDRPVAQESTEAPATEGTPRKRRKRKRKKKPPQG